MTSVTSTVAILSGNTHNIGSGETDINDMVYTGGTLNVLSGGSASYTTDYGVVNVSAGGMDFADYVFGEQYVYGSAINKHTATFVWRAVLPRLTGGHHENLLDQCHRR